MGNLKRPLPTAHCPLPITSYLLPLTSNRVVRGEIVLVTDTGCKVCYSVPSRKEN